MYIPTLECMQKSGNYVNIRCLQCSNFNQHEDVSASQYSKICGYLSLYTVVRNRDRVYTSFNSPIFHFSLLANQEAIKIFEFNET